MAKQRKIVLGSGWVRTHITVDSSALLEGNPNPRQSPSYDFMRDAFDPVIRRSVLYFDRIDSPISNLFSSTVPGFEVLEQQGFLTHTHVQMTPRRANVRFDPYALTLANEHAFKTLDKAEPNTWAFAPLAEHTPWWTPELMRGEAPARDPTSEMQGLLFELYDALPAPASTVHYAEILDFRTRRTSELAAMRAYLDQLYEEIAQSRDFPHARNTVMEKLDTAINDVARTMTEFGMKGSWQSVGVELLFELNSGSGLGAVAAAVIGADVKIGAVVGSGVGLYRFARKNFQSPVERAGPLAYLVRAAQEKVIELPSKCPPKGPGV